MSLRDRARALYRPPFKFSHGYIFDADHNMVADQVGSGDKDAIARIRGWGRIGAIENAEQLQDEVGALLAELLTEHWKGSTGPQRRERMSWISVTDQMPASGRTVLVFYLNRSGKNRTVRGFWAAARSIEDTGDDEETCDYDEATGTGWLHEGWYEEADNFEYFAGIEGSPSHWMPMPEPPVPSGSNGDE